MELLEEMRSELDALGELFPKGVTIPELAGYFGVPQRQIEPVINALEGEGALCVDGDSIAFTDAMPRQAPAERSADAYTLREAIRTVSAEYGLDRPSHEECVKRVRDAVPLLAEYFPNGVSAGELSTTLSLTLQRAHAAIAEAEKEGWCEQVKAYGNRKTGRIAVFEGMLVPPPLLTEMQARVLEWMQAHADKDNICEVVMNRCAADLEIPMVIDKLDSMERKEYIARITPYRMRGKNTSPIFKILPTPVARKPQLFKSIAAEQAAKRVFAEEVEARGMEAVCAEPVAVRRARERKRYLEVELQEVKEFLKTYERLSK